MFVAIGRADRQARFDDAALLLGEELKPGGMYRLLAENGDQLFGDDYFADRSPALDWDARQCRRGWSRR